jgi:glycine dehydrogenase subunit 1
MDTATGNLRFDGLDDDADPVAVVIQQPSFLGTLEDVDRLTDWAHARGAYVIAVANPTSLAVLKAPGHWGEQGADIACGDGQPLGVPLSSGGPYFGYMTCKQKHVRQMPGRIIGRTTDLEGKPGFTLTLQAREQHIRRSKATSNICTNQGLMVTAATIYMSLLGSDGLAAVAKQSAHNTARLAAGLASIDGVERLFDGPAFHEVALKLDRPVGPVLEALAARNILGGYDLGEDFQDLGNALLVCATETKTEADIDAYVEAMRDIFSASV